jgi:hypothetical protein
MILFLFLDGVGLGPDDPLINPFSTADLPFLSQLLGGKRLVTGTAPYEGEYASLLELEQSATGQAALVTGKNVSRLVGEHYGPKPNQAVAEVIRQDNLFAEVLRRGGTAALLNGYPPRYFEGIDSGQRLYSAIPLAATSAGLELMTEAEMQEGMAFAADFTGIGWSAQPGFPPAPIYQPAEAGRKLVEAAVNYDLAWFDFWPSDFAGHRGDMPEAISLLENLDGVLAGITEAWEEQKGLVVISSDHGNLEDLSKRGHTSNPVPALLIGRVELRRRFGAQLKDLASFAPAILDTIFGAER